MRRVVLAGGVESMSRAPWVLLKPERALPAPDTRSCTRRRSAGGWSTRDMPDQWTISLGASAEKLAGIYGISREAQDAVRAAQPPARGARLGRRLATAMVVPVPGIELERDERHPRRHLAREARQARARVRRGRHGHRRELLAAQRRRRRAADRPTRTARRLLGASRWRASSARGAARRRPRRLRHRAGRRRRTRRSARAGIGWDDVVGRRAQRGVRVAVLACLPAGRSSTPTSVNIRMAARSRSAIRWAPRACGSSARLAHELRARGGGYGVAAICIGVGQGLAVDPGGHDDERTGDDAKRQIYDPVIDTPTATRARATACTRRWTRRSTSRPRCATPSSRSSTCPRTITELTGPRSAPDLVGRARPRPHPPARGRADRRADHGLGSRLRHRGQAAARTRSWRSGRRTRAGATGTAGIAGRRRSTRTSPARAAA